MMCNSPDSFPKWPALVLSIVATIVSVLSYSSGREARSVANSLKGNELLRQAWVLLGQEQESANLSISELVKDPMRLQQARWKITDALTLDERNHKALHHLAVYHFAQEQHEEAFKLLEKAKLVEPRSTLILNAMGILHYAKTEWNDAIAAFEKAHAVSPNDGRYLHNIAHVYAEQDMFDRAVPYFEEAVELSPSVWEFHFNLGLAYREVGRHKEAIDELKNALTQKRRILWNIHMEIANTYKGMGDEKRAIKSYKIALSDEPSNADVRVALCELLEKHNQRDEALVIAMNGLIYSPYHDKLEEMRDRMQRASAN